jgi:hypothetical protein
MQKACTAKREKHSEPDVKGTEESPPRSFVCISGLDPAQCFKGVPKGLHENDFIMAASWPQK